MKIAILIISLLLSSTTYLSAVRVSKVDSSGKVATLYGEKEEKEFQNLLKLNKRFPQAYVINLKLGNLYYLKGDYFNSIKHYKRASLVATSAIEPKLGLVRDYLAIRDIDKALAITDSIVKLDFYNYYANYYQLLALKMKAQDDNAIEIAKRMLNLNPKDLLFLQELGKLYIDRDRIKALRIFKRILKLDPNNSIAKKYLTTLLKVKH